MDVDNEAFRRMQVRLPDSTRISDADVQISRQCISAFLSMHTAYELLHETGKVVALDIELPVKQAFHILHEQGIYVAPLWDFGKGKFVGVLSASDFILILREIGNHGSNLTEEELETHTISAWKEGKSYLNRQNNGRGTVFSRGFIHAGPNDNLNAIAIKILQKEVSTVPIVHSSSEDGSFPQFLHLASLSGILKCICRYFRHCPSSLPILQLPICAIPVGTWVPKIGESNRRPLAMLRPSASLASALNLLVQAQALQLGQEAYSPYELTSQRCQMCLRSDSLHKVMERLAKPGVRRLVIVEAGSKRVEGIVSLGSVFLALAVIFFSLSSEANHAFPPSTTPLKHHSPPSPSDKHKHMHHSPPPPSHGHKHRHHSPPPPSHGRKHRYHSSPPHTPGHKHRHHSPSPLSL
ncbi:unnamed protein product [Lupinus luteus]|uniref:CBS domain-containing protein n=1 Tax=Lupinus luteus TaxID=3873 RepID=A0AAV1WZQ8_LUPLU